MVKKLAAFWASYAWLKAPPLELKEMALAKGVTMPELLKELCGRVIESAYDAFLRKKRKEIDSHLGRGNHT